jgi:hypothetical protein
MARLSRMQSIFGLFILLVVILALCPKMINNAYNTLLGRVVLIGLVIFFAMNNLTLGLLIALILILISNMYFVEGMDLMGDTGSSAIVGDDTATSTTATTPGSKIQVLAGVAANSSTGAPALDGSRISQLKAKAQNAQAGGVDKNTIADSLASVPSNSIPLQKPSSSENVLPTDPSVEGFSGMCAKF